MVVNDRIALDEQLSDTVLKLLEAHQVSDATRVKVSSQMNPLLDPAGPKVYQLRLLMLSLVSQCSFLIASDHLDHNAKISICIET